jgi:rhodanese-related sulfurtransferase
VEHAPRFLKLAEDARRQVRELTVEEVKAKLDAGEPIKLVDVREDHEWAKERVRGAEHLGRGILERDIEKRFPDPTTPLILYCGGGYRSALAAESLQKMGYVNVHSMAGGIKAWRKAGLPLDPPAT